MIAIVQRVLQARVVVDAKIVGQIGAGLCVLAAVEVADTPAEIEWVANKLLGLRIFRQGDKHFDLDVQQMAAQMAAQTAPGRATSGIAIATEESSPPGILLISNFTVAADTSSGRRPSLSAAAPPELARERFDQLVAAVRRLAPPSLTIATGEFGADMQVHLVNDGPSTFIVETARS